MNIGQICLQVRCNGPECVQVVLEQLISRTKLKPIIVDSEKKCGEKFSVLVDKNRILFYNVPARTALLLVFHAGKIDGVNIPCG